jgi:RHS repeat-associated protein
VRNRFPKRRRFRVVGYAALATAVVGTLLQAAPAALAATSSSPITYVYDDLGRLEAVVDASQTNGVAKYVYDAVGNLTQITRTAITTTPQIVDFHPHQATTGSPLTIYGAGFSSTIGQNTVKFGTVQATVTAATTSTLVVTVPNSAPPGSTISVKVGTKTGNSSPRTWSPPTAAPSITQMTTPLGGTPPRANWGDLVTLNGSGFAPDPADDLVRINATVAKVTSVNQQGTQLSFQVPLFETSIFHPTWIGSGAVTLRTATGTATAPQELVVPEANQLKSYDKVARVQPSGSQQVTLTSGQMSLLVLVHASESQTLSITLSSSNSEGLGATLVDPLGMSRGALGTDAAAISFMEGDWAIDITRPNGATGSNTITVDTKIADPKDAGSIPTDGVTRSFTCTTRGQQLVGTFQGTAGRSYNFAADGPSATNGFVHIFAPSQPTGGAARASGGTLTDDGAYRPMLGSAGAFQAPETGTYTFAILPTYGAFTTTCPIDVTITDLGTGPMAPRVTAAASAATLTTTDSPSSDSDDVDQIVDAFEPTDPVTWSPTADDALWQSDRTPTPIEAIPPLQAAPGVTGIAGQVQALNGLPLQGVEVSTAETKTTTDKAGRFLLSELSPGHVVITVDARAVTVDNAAFGVFQIAADATKGQTTVLNYSVWEPALDASTRVHIDSYPTPDDLVIKSPDMPGFEVQIPAGSTITDSSGNPVHDVTLTPIPLDRQPFPGPELNPFAMHFTLQPGDATVEPNGFRVMYANNQDQAPGYVGRLWNYEVDDGWESYGLAQVSADAQHVVPEQGARAYGFQGASWSPFLGTTTDPNCSFPLVLICSLDPVDYGNGLFDYHMTDLVEPGTPSISLTRYYRQNDETRYGTGQSMATGYDMTLASTDISSFVTLAIPGQQRVTFKPPTGHTGFPMYAESGPSEWLGAQLDGAYDIRRRDGMRFHFGGPWLNNITDASGNEIIIDRNDYGTIRWILAEPSGRWIQVTREGSFLVGSASDSAGRTVDYSYSQNALYRMLSVTDASQHGQATPKKTTYEWNPDTSLCGSFPAAAPCDPSPGTEIFNIYDRLYDPQVDPIAHRTVHLEYDSQGRVTLQSFANQGQQTFEYSSTDSACAGFTKAVDPNGNITCARFNAQGQISSVTTAQGTALERTVTYTVDQTNKNVTSVEDTFKDLSNNTHTRRTDYTYNTRGAIKQINYLANTGSPKTWLFTYDDGYSGIKKITDPLGHERRFTYSYPDGCITRVEDNLSHGATLTCTRTGAVKTITDDLSNQTTLSYSLGDLTKVTDPTGATTQRFRSADGLLRSISDALGYATNMQYDALGDLKKVTPVSGSSTSFDYDVEQNVKKITLDATGAHTDYGYNELNLASSRSDPLGRSESFTYDAGGNVKKWVDRRNTVTKYCYDAADNLKFIGYGYTSGGEPTCASAFTSSTSFTYDGAGRLGLVSDSRTGNITRIYDDLDRLTSDAGPQGTITYSYDDANRRQSMIVAGQATATTYNYWTNDQLKTITRGTNIVSLAYDAANRPDTTTLPNSVVEDWTPNGDGRLTAASYAKAGQPSLGALSYGYDADGRRTTVWGASGRITLPAATTSNATYDAGNQLRSWNGTTINYDANGNIQTYGAQTYTFDERNQLTATSGGSSTFKYDGLGRRFEKTVSGTTTRYLYDGTNVVQELDQGNNPTYNLINGFAPDQVFWRQGVSGANNVTDSVLTDGLGSTVATTTPVATPLLRNSFTYEPYGKPDSSAFPYLFTGRDYDSSTGLQYNRSRFYSPGLARFTAEDPVGILGGSANHYLYTVDAPTVFKDASGLTPGLGGILAAVLLVAVALAGVWAAGAFFGVALLALAGFGTTLDVLAAIAVVSLATQAVQVGYALNSGTTGAILWQFAGPLAALSVGALLFVAGAALPVVAVAAAGAFLLVALIDLGAAGWTLGSDALSAG